MEYKATDADVAKYLKELKGLIYTMGTSSSTGTENLKVIVTFISDNIVDVLARSNEHMSFLTVRYSRAVRTLRALTDTANRANNLDYRYNFHKSAQLSIKNVSSFMYVVNSHVDQDLSLFSEQISEYRREVAITRKLLKDIQEQVSYLTDIKAELPKLLSLCSST